MDIVVVDLWGAAAALGADHLFCDLPVEDHATAASRVVEASVAVALNQVVKLKQLVASLLA